MIQENKSVQSNNPRKSVIQTNIPQLRFPEFKGEWEMKKLGNVLTRYSEINKNEEFDITHILSLSSQFGIVDRKELLEDTYDKVNYRNYIKTRLNDVVYGKSISANYPFGLFKVNNCRDGLLSTLYFTFRPSQDLNPLFFDKYFSLQIRANNFLRKYVLVGDRYITADSDYILSGSFNMPTLPEQAKIATFLTAVDQKIQALKKKHSLLLQYKKGVMQKIFSVSDRDAINRVSTLRFKDKNGNDFPDWDVKKLGEVCEKQSSSVSANKIEDNFGDYIIYGAAGELKKVDFYEVEEDYISIVKDGAGVGRLLFCKGKSSVLGTLDIIKPTGNIDTYFLYCLLSNIDFSKYTTGSTIPHIYFKDYKNEEIHLPCLEEQTAIANFLSALDEKINVQMQLIASLEQWKKGLLQKMFV